MPNSAKLSELDRALVSARLAWHDRLYLKANWPTPEDPKYADKGKEGYDKYINDESSIHQFLTDDTSFEISRFLFHLRIANFQTYESFETVMRGHNEQIRDCMNDADYYKRTRLKKDRLEESLFSEDQMMMSKAMWEGGPESVIHQKMLTQFLVRIAGKSKINACIKVYQLTDLVKTTQGLSNSIVLSETIELTNAFEAYLVELGKELDKAT